MLITGAVISSPLKLVIWLNSLNVARIKIKYNNSSCFPTGFDTDLGNTNIKLNNSNISNKVNEISIEKRGSKNIHPMTQRK